MNGNHVQGSIALRFATPDFDRVKRVLAWQSYRHIGDILGMKATARVLVLVYATI
jgi:hypothetical protein